MVNLRGATLTLLCAVWAAIIVFGCGGDDKVADPDNHPPTIVSLTADPDTFVASHSAMITVVAEDVDGDALQYDWDIHGEVFIGLPKEAGSMILTNCCAIIEPVSALVYATIDDGRGGVVSDSIRVWAIPGGS